MKRILIVVFTAVVFVSCTSNSHVRFVNGAVVAESRNYSGVFVQVDTSGDGVADVEAEVYGSAMRKSYKRGDSMSVDIRTRSHSADPLLK